MRYREITTEDDLPEQEPADPAGNMVRAYRGIPDNGGSKFETKFGLFFSDSQIVAAQYGPKVLVVEINLANVLRWTAATSRQFQDYVIDWRQQRKSPPGALAALKAYNRAWDGDLTMDDALGSLLREQPGRLGCAELDPLIGYMRALAMELGRDVIARPHEEGGGMKDGTTEYIVFSSKCLKLVRPEVTTQTNPTIPPKP